MIKGAPSPHFACHNADKSFLNEKSFLSTKAQVLYLHTREFDMLRVRAISKPGIIPAIKSSPIDVLVEIP